MLAARARGCSAWGLLHTPVQLPMMPMQHRQAAAARRQRQQTGNSRRAARLLAASSEPLVRADSNTMALPLDYYRMLAVSGVCSRDSLARALEKALSNPPSLGYSQQCLLARGSALKRAVETLLDTQSRRVYDDALRDGDITEDVPDEFVPGVLAVLAEAGDAQTVVAAGEEWLATHRRDPRARDVAIATASAHRSMAESLMKKQGDAVSAAGMLQVALDVLGRHRAAPALQAELAAALAEVQPALACQLVSAPVERFQERERGVKVAIRVLTDGAGSKKGMPKQQFLDCLAENLTAAEQIQVYEAAGSRYAELPSELYDVALAYIAGAASQSQPALLEKALAALAAAAAAVPPGLEGQASDIGVRQLAGRRAVDERHRRQVAYSVCQLLLGETHAAADALGLLDSSTDTVKCERSLMAFIKANSPDRDDLLPGLCVLAQRWVADVAMGSFRGTQGVPFSLEQWFDREEVRRYLTRRQLGPNAAGPLTSTAQRVTSVLMAPMAGVLFLMGLLADEADSAVEQELEPEVDYADGPEDAAPVAVERPASPPPAAAPAPQAPRDRAPPPAPVPRGRSPDEVTAAAAAPDMSQVDMRASRQSRPKAIKPEELKPRHTARPEITEAANAPPPRPVAMPPPAGPGAEFDANVAFAMQPVDQLTPLDGEARMWDPQDASNKLPLGRLAAVVALLASGGFLLGRGMLLRTGGATAAQQLAALGGARAAASVSTQQQAGPALGRADAAAVIAQWQGAKARALGPQHDIQGLSTILRGEVLQQWRERAQQIQQKGWHYLHTMEKSQINGVTMDAATGAARVSATFREAVVAHRGHTDPVQAFRSEYIVDYELSPEDGSWVITAATVRS